MKHFLILIWASMFVFSAQAQTVTIKDEVARYFLERSRTADVLADRLVIKDGIILNQQQTIGLKDDIIELYKQDSVSYESMIKLKDEQIKFSADQLKLAKKEAKKQKRQKKLVILGTIVGVVLLLI